MRKSFGMRSLYIVSSLIVLLALVLAAFAVRGCIWAIRPRQHDDTDTPLLRMLKDD